MGQFLDRNLCDAFREMINSSPIFVSGEKQQQHFYLICAVMDRLGSCIDYLNEHSDVPKSETDFLTFVMHSCMVVDAIKETHKALGIEYNCDREDIHENYCYFKEICKNDPLNLSDEKCPTDDKFFEYFRSLVFAHPFKTDRPKFFKKGEVQYSPFVIPGSLATRVLGNSDVVGIEIYSNIREGMGSIKGLCFSFSVLKDYLKSRYVLVEQATEWARAQISHAETQWKKRKVNRDLPPVEVLRDISEILKSRFIDSFYVEDAIACLNCVSTIPKNNRAVTKFRNAIIKIIPAMCDAVDTLDNETWHKILDDILIARPKNMHNGANYQLEKIFTCLDESHPVEAGGINWGLTQADSFSKEFAKRHVIIQPYEMSLAEIKMLVRVACYLEKTARVRGA